MKDVPSAESIAAPQATRRGFFIGAIYAIWGAITAALAIPAGFYLFAPAKDRKAGEWTDLGDVSRLAPGAPVEMTFRRNRVDGWKVISEKSTVWVVKQAAGQITAFAPQCTHLGCAYHWEEAKNEFVCPCHTSLFSIDGKVISGPAPRPLDRYQTRVENGRLLIGTIQPAREQSA